MGEPINSTTATVEIDITDTLKPFFKRLGVTTAIVEAVKTHNETATATYTADGDFVIHIEDIELVVRSKAVNQVTIEEVE